MKKIIVKKICKFNLSILSLQSKQVNCWNLLAGIWIDRDTHQVIHENRECFTCQWRATPVRVTKVGGLQRQASPQILFIRSFITSPARLQYNGKAVDGCLLITKKHINGKLPEWSNGPHSKCGDRVTDPGVRIPHFPHPYGLLYAIQPVNQRGKQIKFT